MEEESKSMDDLENKVIAAKEITAPEGSIVLYPSTAAKNSKLFKFNQEMAITIDCSKLENKFTGYKSKSTNYGTSLGNLFTHWIKNDGEEPKTDDEKAVNSLIKRLQKTVSFIRSEVPLSGYVFKKGEQWRELYLWKGKADAIGLTKEDRFVIVEWKVTESGQASDHLHQAWVYAKLLKLFLDLDYLPSILIVLIKGVDEVDASLFTTSDDLEEKYKWSAEKPDLTKEIQPGSALFREGLDGGKVDKQKPLHDLFSKSATLEDLQKVFKIPDLEVVSQ
ncbi:uncharacterized protein LOC111325045 [Stylophora pistillata]|uniref:PD-(D/E)XK endonuclease-like domain-containing protein n=1 Tax=Stylophora pistillata TaxID=50429 RepID=A0A2B4SJT7_STYPI|nr:uncharacterized protein LOC111325045 [Stylophora pistillata]PFX29359.1 hypothetical protein AWC38_SpisGene5894 [Stylophora pistillata]